MTGTAGDGLASAFEELLESPQGELLSATSDMLRKHAKAFVVLFFLTMMVGYPLAGEAVEWLLNQDDLVPSDVEIVVLQPLELVILQLQLAAHFAVAVVVLALILDLAWNVGRDERIRSQLAEVALPFAPALTRVLIAVSFSVGLAILGLWYTLDFLLPLLLDYLHADASSVGLTANWQLAAWIGFIAGLCLGSVVGFQVPLLTLLALRGGLVERSMLTGYRRHIFLVTFIVGALLSPPDPLSMLLVAGPMIILFEVALLLDQLLPSSSD